MAGEIDTARREAAERRVREWQEHRMAGIIAYQDRERRRDFLFQKQAIDQNARREAGLAESHRLATERLEREWQQQRDRLGYTPGFAPSFGPAPSRDLKTEYERAREHYLHARKTLENRFEEGLAACQRERAEQLESFFKANTARESEFAAERAREAEKQVRDFEILVHRQMQQPEKSIGEEFARNVRPPDRQI